MVVWSGQRRAELFSCRQADCGAQLPAPPAWRATAGGTQKHDSLINSASPAAHRTLPTRCPRRAVRCTAAAEAPEPGGKLRAARLLAAAQARLAQPQLAWVPQFSAASSEEQVAPGSLVRSMHRSGVVQGLASALFGVKSGCSANLGGVPVQHPPADHSSWAGLQGHVHGTCKLPAPRHFAPYPQPARRQSRPAGTRPGGPARSEPCFRREERIGGGKLSARVLRAVHPSAQLRWYLLPESGVESGAMPLYCRGLPRGASRGNAS